MSLSRVHHKSSSNDVSSSFSARYLGGEAPQDKYSLAPHPITAAGAVQLIKDECLLDGNPTMNLASFVSTWMEDEADAIAALGRNKNIADQEQYPATNEIQERCVNILASLFNSPSADGSGESGPASAPSASSSAERHSVGTSTVGSSEAIMLGGLAMKWRWRQWRAKRMEEEGRGQSGHTAADQANTGMEQGDNKPGVLKGEGWATSKIMSNKAYGPGSGEPPCNLIFSAACHVSILKTCKYLDIEPRIIPLEPGRSTLDPDLVMKAVDENTIGVMAILGNTLTGAFDPIELINDRLIAYNATHGTDIGIHVDGASGAFTVPFSHPDIKFDFRLERVKSINASGHKFGGVYAGVGWIVWREKRDLPEDLVFHVNYLGNDEPTYGLNFSKPASGVLLQYFVFLRLGRDGFKRIINNCLANAHYIAEKLQSTGVFEIMSENLNEGARTIPLVVFRIKPDERLRRLLGFDERELVHEMRTRGWIIPAYSLPANCSDVVVIRIVVRESLSHETADLLLQDIKHKMVELMHTNADKLAKVRLQLQLAHDEAQMKAEEEARRELAAHIMGSVKAQRPHSRIKDYVSGAGQKAAGGLTGALHSLQAGMHAMGLGGKGEADEKWGQQPSNKTETSEQTQEESESESSVHVHTGAKGSAEGGKTQHITSIIC